MNVPNSAPSPENAQGNNQPWFEKIDFWQLVKRSIYLFRANKKKLFVLSLYILLTGGQAITMGNSMLQGPATDEKELKEEIQQQSPSSGSDSEAESEKSWEQILQDIEQEEGIKSALQEIASNKEVLNLLAFFGLALLILLVVTLIATFLMNSHFHLIYIKTLFALEEDQPTEKEDIKEKIKGRWKGLSLMRLIFIAFYLITALIFFSPLILFSSDEKLSASFFGFSSLLAFATFVFISYIFRYSLFYFAESALSIRESIDRGYELFRAKWKETLLASLIGFSASILFGIFFVLCLVTLALLGGLIGWSVYEIAKNLAAAPLIFGVSLFLGILFLLLCFFSLISLWQCFILNFWSLFFREIAGKKIVSPEEAVLLEKKKKLAELAVKKETDKNLKNI